MSFEYMDDPTWRTCGSGVSLDTSNLDMDGASWNVEESSTIHVGYINSSSQEEIHIEPQEHELLDAGDSPEDIQEHASNMSHRHVGGEFLRHQSTPLSELLPDVE